MQLVSPLSARPRIAARPVPGARPRRTRHISVASPPRREDGSPRPDNYAGIWPDLVLSGHAHLYERYTRIMKSDGRKIPYAVAATGGYFNLSGFKFGGHGAKPLPGTVGTDRQGNQVRLEHFDDTRFGFLRVAVTATTITCEFVEADEQSHATTVADAATVPFETQA